MEPTYSTLALVVVVIAVLVIGDLLGVGKGNVKA